MMESSRKLGQPSELQAVARLVRAIGETNQFDAHAHALFFSLFLVCFVQRASCLQLCPPTLCNTVRFI